MEIIWRNGRYYVHVTIEEEIPDICREGRSHRPDTNPDGQGLVRSNYLGQFQESLWLGQGEWTCARSDRRLNLIGEGAALLVEMATMFNCMLIVEDLGFKDDKSVSAKFNRMSHGFVRSTFLMMVERTAARKGAPLVKLKPPFTSIISFMKYQQQYGLSNHEASGNVIARRGLGIDTEKVPDPLVKRFVRKKEGFCQLSYWKRWSAIRKAAVAAIEKATKKEVKSLVSW